MLLQSLAALSQSQTDTDGEALYNLATQLTELTASCDRQMETLLHVADQKAQIQHIQDLHVASALAMGLRKLNASYAKRTAELQETKARNEELRAELEEAWNMAQDMAQEMDDLDNFDLAFSDDEDEYTPNDEDEPSNSALEAEIYNDMDRMSNVSSMRHAEVIEITGKAIATKAMITNISGDGALKPGDRTSRVSAAKKRSSRASKASLRIPRTPRTPQAGNGEQRPDRTSIYSMRSIRSRRSRSKSRRAERGEQSNGVPDVPIIRLPEPSRSREGSFLELVQTRPASPAVTSSDKPPPLPPKGPFEHQLHLNIAASKSSSTLGVAAAFTRSHHSPFRRGARRAESSTVTDVWRCPVDQLSRRGATGTTKILPWTQVLCQAHALDAAAAASGRRHSVCGAGHARGFGVEAFRWVAVPEHVKRTAVLCPGFVCDSSQREEIER